MSFPSPEISTLKTLVDGVSRAVGEIRQKLDELGARVAAVAAIRSEPVPATPPPAMDPRSALTAVAEAVRDAEKLLNEQRLVIATGTVDVDVNLRVGDAVGATAKIHLQIHPEPPA